MPPKPCPDEPEAPRPMAGSRQKLPSAAENRQTAKRRRKRARLMEEAIQSAAKFGVNPADQPYTSVLDALDAVLQRSVAIFKWASAKVDEHPEDDFWVEYIDAQGNKMVQPHKWYALEQAMREEVFDVAAKMAGLDIDDRKTRVQEAQLELLQRALVAAVRAAGLDEPTQRLIGQNLRTELARLQGHDVIEGSVAA